METFTLELTPEIINNNEFISNLQNMLQAVNPNFNLLSFTQYIQTNNNINSNNSEINENTENNENENNLLNEPEYENLYDSNNNFIDNLSDNTDSNSESNTDYESDDNEINPMDNYDTYSEYLNEEENYYNSDNE